MATNSTPVHDSDRNPRRSRPDLIGLWLFLLSVAVMIPGLNRGFILDEYKTWMNCLLPLDVLIRDRLLSGHFPTYFIIAQLWSQLAGIAEWALRVPSVLMVALAVPFVYDMCKGAWNRRTGLICALTFLSHQLVVWMGQTARPYAGLLLFSVVSAWCLVRWLNRGGGGYLVGLVVLTLLGLSFMPLYGLTPLAFAVACAFGFRHSRRAVIAAAALGVAIGAMAVPMLYLARSQQKFQVRSGVEGRAFFRAIDGVQDLLFGGFDSWGRGGLTYVYTVLMIILVTWLVRGRRSVSSGTLPVSPETLVIVWFAVPTIALAIAQGITQKNLLSHERYYAPALGGMAIVIGRGLAVGLESAARRRWHWLVVGSAAVLLVVNTIAWWFDKGEGPRETAAEMQKAANGIPKNVAGHVRWLRYELDGKQPEREFYLERGDSNRVDALLPLFMHAEEGDQLAYYSQGDKLGDIPERLSLWAAGEPFWLFVYLNGRDALDRLAKEPPPGYRRVKRFENLDARAYLFEPITNAPIGLDSETTEPEHQRR